MQPGTGEPQLDSPYKQLFAEMDEEELTELMNQARNELYVRAHFRSHEEAA